MTTEAEQLANELTEPVECFPEPTRLGADNARDEGQNVPLDQPVLPNL